MNGREYYYRNVIPLLRAFFNSEIDLENNGIHPYFWNHYKQSYEKNFWVDKFIEYYDNLTIDPKMAFDIVRFDKDKAGIVDKSSNRILCFWSLSDCPNLPKGEQIYIHYYVCRNFPIFVPIIDRSKYVIDEFISNLENPKNLSYTRYLKDGKEIYENQFMLAFESNLKEPFTIELVNEDIVIKPDNLVIQGI